MPTTNRRQNKAVTIRLTPEEYRLWSLALQKSRAKGQSELLLKLLAEKDIVVFEDFQPLLVELKRQRVNLNQLARHVNRGGPAGNALAVVLKNCNTAYLAVYDAAKRLGVL